MQRKSWVKVLCNLDLYLACVDLAILLVITLLGIILRWFPGNTALWLKELRAFCQVWMIFLGGSAAFRLGNKTVMSLFDYHPFCRRRRIIGFLVDLILIFTMFFLATVLMRYISWFYGTMHLKTEVLKIPYELIYGITPFGCALMVINYLLAKYLPGFANTAVMDAEDGNNGVAVS